MYKKKEPTALEGMGDGIKAIGTGIVAGATGLFVQPAMGAKEDGVKGMVVGVGQGVMGAVVLPVAGLLGGIRRMGTGIKNGIVGPSESSTEEAPADGQTEFDQKLEKRYLADREALLTQLAPLKAIMNAPGLDEAAPVDIHLYMALSLPPTATPRDITFAYVKASAARIDGDGHNSLPSMNISRVGGLLCDPIWSLTCVGGWHLGWHPLVPVSGLCLVLPATCQPPLNRGAYPAPRHPLSHLAPPPPPASCRASTTPTTRTGRTPRRTCRAFRTCLARSRC
eukprot:jgi/Mesvir1/23944/Mv10715-RA.1